MEKVKCGVVMLATDKATEKGILTLGKEIQWNIPGEFRGTKFHLYLISDEEIKTGDYIIPSSISGYSTATQINDDNTIDLYNETSTLGGFNYVGEVKKIVATTNPELNLPVIPQNFIEKYVEANGKIEEVEIEVVEVDGKLVPVQEYPTNAIVISQSKKTWTRDEVEYLLNKLHYHCCLEYPITLNCNIWIKDNLK